MTTKLDLQMLGKLDKLVSLTIRLHELPKSSPLWLSHHPVSLCKFTLIWEPPTYPYGSWDVYRLRGYPECVPHLVHLVNLTDLYLQLCGFPSTELKLLSHLPLRNLTLRSTEGTETPVRSVSESIAAATALENPKRLKSLSVQLPQYMGLKTQLPHLYWCVHHE